MREEFTKDVVNATMELMEMKCVWLGINKTVQSTIAIIKLQEFSFFTKKGPV